MRTIALMGAAVLAVVAPAAYAAPTIHFNAGSGATAPGTTVFQNFESYAPGASIGTNAAIYSATALQAVRPGFGSTGNFAAVLGGGSYTVNFGPTNLFSFVLGSLDTYNTLTLKLADNSTVSYTGGQIIGGLAFASGSHTSPTSNGVVTFNANGGPEIIGATFTSLRDSFEVDNLARGVPEPATWALMILGFGAIGSVMRRRQRATVPA